VPRGAPGWRRGHLEPAGSNVWMLADWSDQNPNVNLFLPREDVARDAPLVAVLARTTARVDGGGR
jgi:hypothetical protein